MNNKIANGDTVTVTAPYAVTAGQAVKVGMWVGIATNAAAQGADVTLDLTGVFYVDKTSAQAWTKGQGIYWNDGSRVFTSTGTGGVSVGEAWLAAANPSSKGYVRLPGRVTANQADGSS